LVDVQSLVKSLKQKSSNAHIVKKIASVHNPKKNATLPKPLEKIHADKVSNKRMHSTLTDWVGDQ
jgi:hypothetical protein